jgi:hypothetical protein
MVGIGVELIEIEKADAAKGANVRVVFFTSTRERTLAIWNTWFWQNRMAGQNASEAIWMSCMPEPTVKLCQDTLSLQLQFSSLLREQSLSLPSPFYIR